MKPASKRISAMRKAPNWPFVSLAELSPMHQTPQHYATAPKAVGIPTQPHCHIRCFNDSTNLVVFHLRPSDRPKRSAHEGAQRKATISSSRTARLSPPRPKTRTPGPRKTSKRGRRRPPSAPSPHRFIRLLGAPPPSCDHDEGPQDASARLKNRRIFDYLAFYLVNSTFLLFRPSNARP